MKELEQHLLDLVGCFMDRALTNRKEKVKECQASQLTECQERYLRLIDENEPLTSGEFARLICVSKPTVSQLLNRFCDSGYITKEICPTDRRVCYIRMTERGRQVARVDQSVRIETTRYIQTSLSEDELKQLITLLDKLI